MASEPARARGKNGVPHWPVREPFNSHFGAAGGCAHKFCTGSIGRVPASLSWANLLWAKLFWPSLFWASL
jgi:hypothetical protein